MSESCGLRDFVPEVLNVAIPEVSNHSPIGPTSFAVDLSQRLFTSLKTLVYPSLVSAGDGSGLNSSARARAKGVTAGHCGKSAGAKLGGVNW